MTQIGKYEIVRQTGHTPLGTIYEAFDPVMRRTVSIQAPEDESPAREPLRRQTSQLALQKGGECLGRLHHPNIRNIIATEESDGALYLIMEHVHAQPVSERISTNGLPPNEALRLLKMAALALDHAHHQNVFHPGLTPAHLLLEETGLLKVAGFEMSGLPGMAVETMTAAEIDVALQSTRYRAPEFLAGESADACADQFSLAAIAFELFTGQVAFPFDSPIATMAAILSGDGPDLTILDRQLPPAVHRVFEKALASDPSLRYASCTAMLEALETALVRKAALPTRAADSPYVPTPTEPQPVKRATPRPRPVAENLTDIGQKHSRRMRWLLAVACLATVVVIALILLQLRSGPPVRTKPVTPAAIPAQLPAEVNKKPNPPITIPAPAAGDGSAKTESEAEIVNKAKKDAEPPAPKKKRPPRIDLPEPKVSQ
jgi:eukaryotic-like serine/threonine-protein kinase